MVFAIVVGLLLALVVYYVLALIVPAVIAGLIAVLVFLAFAFGGRAGLGPRRW